MERLELVARSRKALKKGIIYKLGKGGRKPEAKLPSDDQNQCDCTGFVAWCLMIDRYLKNVPWYVQQNGGWLETSAVFRDAQSPYGFFQEVPWEEAMIGDFLVYGDKKGSQGHIGLITSTDDTGPTRAIHCSSGNYKKHGDAIRETSTGLWKLANGIVARCAHVGA